MADPGFKVLEDRIAMLRILGENLTDECVDDVARVVDADVKKTIAAGTDAYGDPWPPNKDGSPFRFVKASDVVTGAIGRTIITRIKTRTAVLHHHGFARGGVKRSILPTNGKLPDRMRTAITDTIAKRFRTMTGGTR